MRNLRYPIAPFSNLDHRLLLELFAGAAFELLSLLASNLGENASTNLGAIHYASHRVIYSSVKTGHRGSTSPVLSYMLQFVVTIDD